MRNLFALSAVILLLLACQKEEKETIPENNPPVEEPNYFPMEIGSYWVYENYKIDAEGEETKLPELDSVVVSRDTLINNETYYVFEGKTHPFTMWKIQSIVRDSATYIIDFKGNIVFSIDHLLDTINKNVVINNSDTMYALYYLMNNTNYPVSTTAGDFDAFKVNGHFYMKRDSLGNLMKDERELDYYYSPDIGRTIGTLFYASTDWYWEKRLLRYYIPETT